MWNYCKFLFVFYLIFLTYHNVCGQNSEQFLFVTKDPDIFTRRPARINNLGDLSATDELSSVLARSKRDTKNSIPFSLGSQGKNITTLVSIFPHF